MKILHTSDWHLGHQLHGYSRDTEHQLFLDWLVEILIDEEIDALLVAGDIFDTANPPATAWQMLYRFLATLSKQLPHLNVVMIGGNHDSPSKLDAPHELLRAFDLHLVGGIRRNVDGMLETERMLVPLTDKKGQTAAWVMAVPFLRSSDLRTENLSEDDDRLVKGVEQLYTQVTAAALSKRSSDQALIAMGHAYMAASQLSEMSERRVLGGNQHALPVTIFDESISYVALGHLHLAQRVGGKEHVRYSGSPIPLSMSEKHYKHQVAIVTLTDAKIESIETKCVPRAVDMLSIPAQPQPLDKVLEALEAAEFEEKSLSLQPLLEVPVLLDKPQAMLREKVLAAMGEKAVRLAKITPHYPEKSSSSSLMQQQLSEVSPQDVFSLSWQQRYDGEPDEEMREAFEQLLIQVEEQEAEQ
ncbi:exonuclease SbcCD subunit D [Thaumasiovibrio subtropicus]|uniref:exonuclease SbcCD subunit D n=1 Tax=Thaumasiovibrio subtropicus TaxID=1891207 RepID=UPI000B35604D|nr:exonuclease SbcCD subunit D C-terminal domain-containing protein [Thaumasiovibrio subtropicus]